MNCQKGDVCKRSRERSGLKSNEAAQEFNISTRTLDRYEAGEYDIPEDVLIQMSKTYHDPFLPWNYLVLTNPIAQYYGLKPFEEASFSTVALRIINGLNIISREREEFAEITADEKVDSEEDPRFTEIISTVESVSQGMAFLKLINAAKEKTTFAKAV